MSKDEKHHKLKDDDRTKKEPDNVDSDEYTDIKACNAPNGYIKNEFSTEEERFNRILKTGAFTKELEHDRKEESNSIIDETTSMPVYEDSAPNVDEPVPTKPETGVITRKEQNDALNGFNY